MITNGLRYTQKAGYGVSLLPSSDSIQAIKTSLLSSILDGTKPFFTKPLTTEAVQQKLVIEVRPEQAPMESLTNYTLQWKALFISSSSFRCVFEIVSKEDVLSHTLIDISFFEGEKAETAEVAPAHEGLSDACETIPLSSADPILLGDARQVELKKLRRARMKAARALLRSEQQYSEYVERYGDLESDWEDSSDEEDSEDEEDEEEGDEGEQGRG